MNFETFYKNLLNDLKTELKDEFDKNFQRKAFFNEKWAPTKGNNKRGSLMMRTGTLRRSVKANVIKEGVHFTSSEPYAEIQNEGGTLTVTAKMKKYFWARYYKASGGMTKTKTGRVSNNARNRDLNAEAQFWKAMALKKVGSKIKIPARRFIGDHPQVHTAIKSVLDENMKKLSKKMIKEFKP